VRVPGLLELGEGTNYVLVGTPDANDPCRSTPPTSLHYESHYGTAGLNTSVIDIADDYASYAPGIRIRINDMSLEWGGLFDIGNNWSSVPGHSGHRIGRNARYWV